MLIYVPWNRVTCDSFVIITGVYDTKVYTIAVKIYGRPHSEAWRDWDGICDGAQIESGTSSTLSGK